MKVVSSSCLVKRTGSERSNADVRNVPSVTFPCNSMPVNAIMDEKLVFFQELHIAPELLLIDIKRTTIDHSFKKVKKF